MKKGNKINKLTALNIISDKGTPNEKWLFMCDCGREKAIRKANVLSGRTKSCGCYRKEWIIKKMKTHGYSQTRFYRIFSSLKDRCNNPSNRNYKYYGGRGIKNEWKNFEEFMKDMEKGYNEHIKKFGEKDTTINRVNNDGNYNKGNCEWATIKEQANNTRRNRILCFKTKTYSIKEFSEEFGIKENVLRIKLCRGRSLGEIISGVRKKKELISICTTNEISKIIESGNKKERNKKILELYRGGFKQIDIARLLKISRQRVKQILMKYY